MNKSKLPKVNMKNSKLHRTLSRVVIIAILILMIIPQTGCQKKKDPTPLWDEGFYFGTVCRITLYATDDELKMSVAKPILNDAFDLIRRYDTILNKDKDGSDIWRVNNSDGNPIQCDPDTVSLLWDAMNYCDLTEGVFDITIGGVIDLWDFNGAAGGNVPTSAELSRELRHVNYRNIKIDGNNVTVTDPAAQIDLDGIAEGFIASRVAQYLRTRGVTGAVIDFGGNIEIVGYKAGWVPLGSEVEEKGDVDGDGIEETVGGIAGGAPFVIGVKKPYSTENEIIGTLTIANSSMATAGLDRGSFEVNGKTYNHFISSKTGYPVNNDLVSVTVVGPANTAARCDALSTICMLLGKSKATEFMDRYPEYGVIFIDQEGEITTIGKKLDIDLTGEAETDLTEEGIRVD